MSLVGSLGMLTFKVPTWINHIYEHSPYYIGTLLWNALPQAVQESNSIFEFKRELGRMNRTYEKL